MFTNRRNANRPTDPTPTPAGTYACCGETFTCDTYAQVARAHRVFHALSVGRKAA